MSKRAIAVLGVITAALLAYVLGFERTSVTSKELAERKGRVLTSFVRDKVERLELERNHKRIVLERKPDDEGELRGFRVLEPFQAEADEDLVDQVLGELEWLSARRTLAGLSAEDEKRFGLHAPRYRVAYAIGGARHVLEVGNEDVHGEGVYTRVDREARAHVVPKTLLDVLKHEPGEFRDKQQLPDLTVAWARKLAIHQQAITTLTKEKERWWLELEPRGYADDKRVEALLNALADLRAVRYVEPEQQAQAEAALAAPSVRIEVDVVPDETREDRTAKQLGLAIGGPCLGHEGERYARTLPRGAPVCIRDQDAQALTVSASELRDLRLIRAEPSAVESFELVRGKDKLAVARDGEKWKADGAPVDRDTIDAWLTELGAERASRVFAAPNFREQGSFTLVALGGKRERISIGEERAGELLVKRDDEPVVAAFPASLADRLAPVRTRFASLALWSGHQPSEVQRIEARDRELARTLALRDGAWQSESGAVDSLRVRELVRALITARARAFVSEQPRANHGFASEPARVRLALGDGSTLTVTLGAATPRGAYARIDEQRVVEVGSELLGLVRELAGGPRAVLAAPGQAEAPSGLQPDLEEHEDEEHEDHEH